jgi:hypothetical protein
MWANRFEQRNVNLELHLGLKPTNDNYHDAARAAVPIITYGQKRSMRVPTACCSHIRRASMVCSRWGGGGELRIPSAFLVVCDLRSGVESRYKAIEYVVM